MTKTLFLKNNMKLFKTIVLFTTLSFIVLISSGCTTTGQKTDTNNKNQSNTVKTNNTSAPTETATSSSTPAATLNTKITYSDTALKVQNNDDKNWTNCWFQINWNFVYETKEGINAMDSLIIPEKEFATPTGTRFNPSATKVKNIGAACDTERGRESNYFTIE